MPADPPMQSHAYIATIANVCLVCHLPMSYHPTHVTKVEPVEVVPLERRYPSIGAQGQAYGPGRGELTHRQKMFLLGWLGWTKWNDRENERVR